jgi:hypothetical protein
MRTRTRCSTRQLVMLGMIFQPHTISTTLRSTCRNLLGTWLPRVVVQILAWRQDIVMARALPHHMPRSRPTGTLPMTIPQVTFHLQAHVFPTSHRFTFTTTYHHHHPARPLRCPRFHLITTLTHRCIPTRTPALTHLNHPLPVRNLRVHLDRTTLRVLPFGEASVAITGELYRQRGPLHRQSYLHTVLEINFVSGQQPHRFIRKARYILILRHAPGRPRPPSHLRLFLVLPRTCLLNLLIVTPSRHFRRRSFPPLTHLGRTKVPHRRPPLHRGAQKITTRRVLSFREALTEVERAAGTSRQPYTTRIRCPMPAHRIILRALMRCFRSRNHNHGRRGRRCTQHSIQGYPL